MYQGPTKYDLITIQFDFMNFLQLSPVEAAAERIERELSKDLFGDVAMGSPAGGDNGISGLLDVDSFDPLLEAVVSSAKWDTFSASGDPERDGREEEEEGGRVVVPMSPIRSPPRKELSPTGM